MYIIIIDCMNLSDDLLAYLLVCAYTCDVCTVYVGALNTRFCVDMFMLHT